MDPHPDDTYTYMGKVYSRIQWDVQYCPGCSQWTWSRGRHLDKRICSQCKRESPWFLPGGPVNGSDHAYYRCIPETYLLDGMIAICRLAIPSGEWEIVPWGTGTGYNLFVPGGLLLRVHGLLCSAGLIMRHTSKRFDSERIQVRSTQRLAEMRARALARAAV